MAKGFVTVETTGRIATVRFDRGDKAKAATLLATVCKIIDKAAETNVIHANKAYRPDPPERLNDLLQWAQRFIHSVYETNSPLAERAMEIKATLRIENF